MKFIKHIVPAMDESMFQRCLICGAIVNDRRGMACAIGSELSIGFPAGEVYVTASGNPKITTVQEPSEFNIENCKP